MVSQNSEFRNSSSPLYIIGREGPLLVGLLKINLWKNGSTPQSVLVVVQVLVLGPLGLHSATSSSTSWLVLPVLVVLASTSTTHISHHKRLMLHCCFIAVTSGVVN
jgi:hypothetical protein